MVDREYYKMLIKFEMEGIRKEDLQRRLKDFYLNREKLKSKLKKSTILTGEMKERIHRMLDDNNIYIETYEEELDPEIVERAKRSAGIDETLEKRGFEMDR